MISKKLLTAIKNQFAINWYGIHGICHWGRVYQNGLKLSELTGANTAVVELFSVFHDACRLNEGIDNGHGIRGAELAKQLRLKYFDLPDPEFELLITACSQHKGYRTHENITVRTCFDADRLDIARVGKVLDPRKLCTEAAKNYEIIQWASENSQNGHVADIVHEWDIEFSEKDDA